MPKTIDPQETISDLKSLIEQFDPQFDDPLATLQDIADILKVDKTICEDDDDDEGDWVDSSEDDDPDDGENSWDDDDD